MSFCLFQVAGYHFPAHFLYGDFRYPAEFFPGFGRVAQQCLHFGRAEVTGIDFYDYVPGLQGGCFVTLDSPDYSAVRTVPRRLSPGRSPIQSRHDVVLVACVVDFTGM